MINLLYFYFYNDIFDLKDFDTKLLKIDKKLYKIIDIVDIDTTLDTSQLKSLMIMRVFMVEILCICVLVVQVDILKKKMEINT